MIAPSKYPPSLPSLRRLFLVLLLFLSLPALGRENSDWLFLGSRGAVHQSGPKVRVISRGQSYSLQWVDPENLTAQGEERRSRTLARQDLETWLEKVLAVRPAAQNNGTAPARVPLNIRLEIAGSASMEEMDGHGFTIDFRAGAPAALTIRSPSALGIRFGVWFFLQNLLDVRLLMPGEVGQVFSPQKKLQLPRRLLIENPHPDFLLRTWTGAAGWEHNHWLGEFGSQNRYQYHHNLWRIFDPKTTFADHPEFFPVHEGQRFEPKPGSRSGWQPTFSEPGLVEHTLGYAERHFAARPQDRSISLSINDGRGYSEQDLVPLPGKTPQETLRHHYFNYVRRVAEAFRERWPGKKVAFIPYMEMAHPPEEPLPDNVMVFLFLEPWEQLRRWQGRAHSFGLYLWLFGKGWVFPNHWPMEMQALLRKAKEFDIVVFKGEGYPAWSLDGPKLWVLNHLLWNTEADVNALMADYCRHAYGKKAAGHMLQFFARAEAVYQRRKEGDLLNLTRWRPGQYQFEKVSPADMIFMRRALDQARAAASGPAQKQRLEMVHQGFSLAELFWKNHHHLQTLTTRPLQNSQDVHELAGQMSSLLAFEENLATTLQGPIRDLAGYSLFGVPGKPVKWFEAQPGCSWAGQDTSLALAASRISRFFLAREDAPVAVNDWRKLLAEFPLLLPYGDTEINGLLEQTRGDISPLVNGRFEASADHPPEEQSRTGDLLVPGWTIHRNRSVQSFIEHHPQGGPAGRPSISAFGFADRAGIYQNLKLESGRRYRVHFWYRTSPGSEGFLQIKTSPGINGTLPASSSWRSYSTTFAVPGKSHRTTYLLLLVGLNNGRSLEDRIEISDFRLEIL